MGRTDDIGICDLNGNYESIAKKVVGLSRGALSPDGRRLVVTKADSIYGQAIIDFATGSLLEIPQLAGYQDNSTFAWSKNGRKVAFYLYNRELDNPRFPYTTGAKLAVAEVLPNGKIGFHTYDSPCPGSWFFIGGALSWFGDDVVVASLTNETSVGLEVR